MFDKMLDELIEIIQEQKELLKENKTDITQLLHIIKKNTAIISAYAEKDRWDRYMKNLKIEAEKKGYKDD